MNLFSSHRVRYIAALLLLALGLFLITTKVDRQLLVLPPTPGATYNVPLAADTTYAQTFVFTRSALTRLGYYFTGSNLPNAAVTLTLKRGNTILAQTALSTIFINTDDASDFTFSPAVKVTPGETLQAIITVPPQLNNLIHLNTRKNDGSFKAADTVFTINDVPQLNPLAYQADYGYRLPFAVQIGALSLLAALYLILHPRGVEWRKNTWLIIIAIAVSTFFAIPVLLLGGQPWLLVTTQAAALLGMFIFLKQANISHLAAMFGAIIFSFTSWFALQYSAQHPYLLAIALLPAILTLIVYRRSISTFWQITLIVAILVTGLFIVLAPATPIMKAAPVAAHFQDIFLDPNQSPAAQKFDTLNTSTSWDHFGSYIGMPAALFVLLGLFTRGKRNYKWLMFAVIIGGITLISPIIKMLSAISPQYAIILLTFSFAFFASQGFEVLYTFLGKHHKIVPVMMTSFVIIVLLDLYTISATVLEYPFLK
jgi:hypothetical protein